MRSADREPGPLYINRRIEVRRCTFDLIAPSPVTLRVQVCVGIVRIPSPSEMIET